MKGIVHKLTDKIVSCLLVDKAIDDTEAEAYKFGVEVMLLKAAHISSYMLIAAVMKKIPEFLIIFGILSFFRRNTGGFHAKTRMGCYVFSCTAIAAGLFLADGFRYVLPWQVHLFLAAGICLMWRLTPVEHQNRKLDQEEVLFFKRRQIWDSIIFFILYITIWAAAGDIRLPYFMAVGMGLNTVLAVLGKLRQ